MKTAGQIATELTDFTGYPFSEQVVEFEVRLLKWESEIREDQIKKTIKTFFDPSDKLADKELSKKKDS